MCNPNGGIIDDSVFANIDQDDYHYMVINAGRINEDLAHIDSELSSFNSRGKDVRYDFIDTDSLIAFQGKAAVDTMSQLVPEFDFNELKFFYLTQMKVKGIPVQVSRTGYTGEDGFEVLFFLNTYHYSLAFTKLYVLSVYDLKYISVF